MRGLQIPYWAWFSMASALVLAVLLFIVFQLFPPRFVLAPGLREQDLNFTAQAPAYEVPVPPELIRPPPPRRPPAGPATGPAEELWSAVGPLLEDGRYGEALPLLAGYLERRPADHDVRLEYARALEAAGRLVEAERAFARVASATGARAARLELARVRWRLGDTGGALRLYRELAAAPGTGVDVRLERARLLASVGRYDEAEGAYRELLAASPDPAHRLELARMLYGAGRPMEAWRVARRVGRGTPERAGAEELMATLRSQAALPAGDTVPSSLLARAADAAAAGDLERATRLYRGAVLMYPGREAPRLALAELLATRRGDPDGARRVLMDYRARPGTRPSVELRRRLARYHLWAGDDAAAHRVLAELARDGETSAADLALLGDLERWRGRRPEADDWYARALAAEPRLPRALEGRDSLRSAAAARVRSRDPRGAGLSSELYVDSDDFRRWGLTGRSVLGEGDHRLEARAGVRSLRGPGSDGRLTTATGPVGSVALTSWWRQATVRTRIGAGVERYDPTGAEPFVSAAVELPDAGLAVAYDHEPAHGVTQTFASFQQETVADRVRVSLYRGLGRGPWALWVSGEAGSVRGAGVDNGRFVGQASLDRAVGAGGDLGGDVRIGYATRLLSTSSPAPLTGTGAASYWSPALSWSHALTLSAERAPEEGWGWLLRARPGGALVDLHGPDEPELVFRFAGEAGASYTRDDTGLRARLGYLRSRLRGYEAVTGELELFVRF